jgi:hypothetical protein
MAILFAASIDQNLPLLSPSVATLLQSTVVFLGLKKRHNYKYSSKVKQRKINCVLSPDYDPSPNPIIPRMTQPSSKSTAWPWLLGNPIIQRRSVR